MVKLRTLTEADEAACRAIHEQMATQDDFEFVLASGTWDQILGQFADEAAGRNLPEGRVPCDFFVAEVDGEIVGRTSIRRELNDFLLRVGGHIGYGVAPAHRRKGYATEILRQSLAHLKTFGVERALVTCDDDNIGSATVIERCGGVLENVERPADGGTPKRRYWIALE